MSNPPRAPEGFLEHVEAANVANDEAGRKITLLTCKTFAAGVCTEPGFTIDPERAVELLKDTDKVRETLRASLIIPPGGLGQCGETVASREACLASALKLFETIERATRPSQ
jgi:predicted RNA-binding Zn ribbon-like protein